MALFYLFITLLDIFLYDVSLLPSKALILYKTPYNLLFFYRIINSKLLEKKISMLDPAKNRVISPNFLVWKFCGKAQFPHSFGELPETMRKLYLSTKFPHQEITWNYGIFRSGIIWKWQWRQEKHFRELFSCFKECTHNSLSLYFIFTTYILFDKSFLKE